MTGNIRALDGSVIEFVKPARGMAPLYRDLVMAFNVAHEFPYGVGNITTSSFSTWYNSSKKNLHNIAFIRKRGNAKFIGIIYGVWHKDITLYTVAIHPGYRGNGYARAAIILACENAYSSTQDPNRRAGLLGMNDRVATYKLISGFPNFRHNKDLETLTASWRVSEVIGSDVLNSLTKMN